MRDALESSRGAAALRVVAIDLDLVLDAPHILHDDAERARGECRQRIEASVAEIRGEVQASFGPARGAASLDHRVLGVMFSATFVVGGGDATAGPYASTRFETRTVASSEGPVDGRLELFADVLTIGEQVLHARR